MYRGHVDARIAETFARQHGLITTAQAFAFGLTPDAIRHLVRTGRWERVRTGLYRLTGMSSSTVQTILGVVLCAGEPAWASHFTAEARR